MVYQIRVSDKQKFEGYHIDSFLVEEKVTLVIDLCPQNHQSQINIKEADRHGRA